VSIRKRNSSSFPGQDFIGLPGALNFDYQKQITKFIFFTGKGGVGKTSLSCSVALALASNLKKKVLLISTDPASNLDEIFSTTLSKTILSPSAIAQVPNLRAINIDPNSAAESYRRRVLEPYEKSGSGLVQKIREQLSGACTTEVATFDEFAELLANEQIKSQYDHLIFDTAPTGHTLRLLKLPMAWSSFLDSNQRGASCIGPHSGLTMQQNKFHRALEALTDSKQCTIVIVSRPEYSALKEAERTHQELTELSLRNQQLVINGVFQASDRSDKVAMAIEMSAKKSLDSIPQSLASLPQLRVPLRPINFVGIEALKELLSTSNNAPQKSDINIEEIRRKALGNNDWSFDNLIATLMSSNQKGGLIMVMGKGGVGKTTIAAAIAIKLAKLSQNRVHLTTTDPAAHLNISLQHNELPSNLFISSIDPKQESQNYIDKVMAAKGEKLDEEGKEFLKEDLQSPCTEEVAVFHAFSRVVSEAKNNFVVMDTAPTGHTLLLLDATGSYHREVLRSFETNTEFHGRITTPLLRLQDSNYTKVLIVTHAENTPVTEAEMLQGDLKRAGITPHGWIVNKSLLLTNTTDPVLAKRMESEVKQLERVRSNCSGSLVVIPWLTEDPVKSLTYEKVC
jgi:arsenite-transporting ATPase